MEAKVQTGLEVLLADPTLVRGRRIGILANQASVTSALVPAWRAIAAAGARVERIFAPEHGLWGVAQDMEAVADEREPLLGVPIASLYGASAATLAPSREQLAGLDAVVVDLPDVGCRVYTFAATLAYVMAGCEDAAVEVIVCDRPNPIGGVAVEGGPVEPGCRSFVSEPPVPLRHGLTLGEIALLLREERHPRLALAVHPCRGWRRQMWWDETGLPWVAPSPNMPTPRTAAVYPGACLIEATNLSEGRGTTRPFQLIGAPWLDGEALAERLNALALPGARFRATRFRPEFGKHANVVCGGVEWHVTDREALRPVEAGVRVLAMVREAHPERFAWRSEAYEFVGAVPAIDLLTGSARARTAIEGGASVAGMLAEWDAWCRGFRERSSQYRLYSD